MATRFSRVPIISLEYKSCDRNYFVFGWTPQAEI